MEPELWEGNLCTLACFQGLYSTHGCSVLFLNCYLAFNFYMIMDLSSLPKETGMSSVSALYPKPRSSQNPLLIPKDFLCYTESKASTAF